MSLQSNQQLALHRLVRANSDLADATLLLEHERWKSAVNRMCYACFHAVSAYLVLQEINTATHNGVKSNFNQLLIKSGLLARAHGATYNGLLELRQDADYDDYSTIEGEDVVYYLEQAAVLVAALGALVRHEIEKSDAT